MKTFGSAIATTCSGFFTAPEPSNGGRIDDWPSARGFASSWKQRLRLRSLPRAPGRSERNPNGAAAPSLRAEGLAGIHRGDELLDHLGGAGARRPRHAEAAVAVLSALQVSWEEGRPWRSAQAANVSGAVVQ